MATNPYLNVATILIGGATSHVAKIALGGKQALKNIDYEDMQIDYSKLGTPIYSNLWFGKIDVSGSTEDPKYIDVDGKEKTYKPVIVNNLLLNVTPQKNIIKTPVNGRNGTVKQYISDGDYQIEAKITIASNKNQYPEDEVKELIALCQLPIPIPVNSWYLDMFGITDVVIESYQMGQMEGNHNMQVITINMISDSPIDLEAQNA